MNIGHIVTAGLLGGVITVISLVAQLFFSAGGFGASFFFVGWAFYLAAASWFGIWGLIANQISAILSGYIVGRPIPVIITLWHAFLGPGLFMILMKGLKANPELKSIRDYAIFLGASVAGAFVTVLDLLGTMIYVFQLMPVGAFNFMFVGLVIGDFLVTVIIGIPMFKYITPYVKDLPVYVEKYLA